MRQLVELYLVRNDNYFHLLSGTSGSNIPYLKMLNMKSSGSFVSVQLGITKQILIQRKDGSISLTLLSKQFHRRRKELFFFFGVTQLRRNPSTFIKQA